MKKKIKTSPFTLAQTWEHCLAMWKWISENYAAGTNTVSQLKEQWIKENGFVLKHTLVDCFFCDYSNRQKNAACSVSCPGVMVAPQFDCCHPAYSHDTEPKKFYQNLLRIHRKWRNNKK